MSNSDQLRQALLDDAAPTPAPALVSVSTPPAPLLFSASARLPRRRHPSPLKRQASVRLPDKFDLRKLQRLHHAPVPSPRGARRGSSAPPAFLVSDAPGPTPPSSSPSSISSPSSRARCGRFLSYYVPMLGWLPQYRWALAGHDAAAGLTAAALLVPQVFTRPSDPPLRPASFPFSSPFLFAS